MLLLLLRLSCVGFFYVIAIFSDPLGNSGVFFRGVQMTRFQRYQGEMCQLTSTVKQEKICRNIFVISSFIFNANISIIKSN